MASVNSVRLAVAHDHTTRTAKVSVVAQLGFSAYELSQMQLGLRFKCRCELWGADSGLTGADDFLYTMFPKYFPDATPAALEEVKFEQTLGEGVLNEDIGTDEVYAKIILQNLYTTVTAKRNSNQVSHRF